MFKTIEIYLTKRRTMSSNIQFSICIPCVPKHIPHLCDLLDSIDSQSVKPLEVIIGLSSIPQKDSDLLLEKLTQRYKEMNIIVSCCTDKAFASVNRNRCGKLASGTYIVFMDADDLMRYDKLEVIKNLILKKKNVDALIHTFGGNDTAAIVNPAILREERKRLKYLHLDRDYLNLKNHIHHGHITVKKSVFDKHKQSEDKRWRRGQDVEYVTRLIISGLNVYLIDKCLSMYRQYLSSEK